MSVDTSFLSPCFCFSAFFLFVSYTEMFYDAISVFTIEEVGGLSYDSDIFIWRR